MRGPTSHRRSYLDPITDRLRSRGKRDAGKLPTVILFAAVVGVIPLAYVLESTIGMGWLGSALAAIAISAIVATGAFMVIGT